jgi:DNA-binding response OmpR family regulator
MTNKTTPRKSEPDSAPPQCQSRRPSRILVVEDERLVRKVTAKKLIESGYEVDDAEDGEAAWRALQCNSYDLLITDNKMPKVTGVELIRKVRAARMALPIIMATGAEPEEVTHNPSLQPAAVLLKPFTLKSLLETVRTILLVAAPIVMLQLCLTGSLNAQEKASDPQSPARSQDSAAQPDAITLSVRGKCDYSRDGVTFSRLERGQDLEQGAIVLTGATARTDLFFRRTGTVVRLQEGTEIRLEKMTLTTRDGLPVVHTLLDLRKGRIFTVVRSAVAGSTLEIRNAAGRAVVEGSGIGRYIITADGTHVAATGSVIPLKVIGESGITVIAAGEQFAAKDGKPFAVSTSLWVKELIELDELQATTEGPVLTAQPSKP